MTRTRGSTHDLSVVEALAEGDVGLEVDDDGEVEDDEAHHQVLVDGQPGAAQGAAINSLVLTRAANDPSVFTITEKALTRAFCWLKAPTRAFTFKTL